MDEVEVIIGHRRRRRWTAEQKRAIVEEAEEAGNSISAVARKYEVSPNQVFHWRKLMRAGALVAAGAEDAVVPLSEARALQVKIRELERLLGKKTMEVEILKDALELAREKKLLLPGWSPRKDATR